MIATCRTPEKAAALSKLKSSAKRALYVVKLQVDDFDSICALLKAIAPILGENGLDYLFNIAGIVSKQPHFVSRNTD
ncbi:hypothetical protein TRAPUB_12320 [Trametes pubescens]|uniref:Uncharacterized protein n=1 Tax=Trametes pubescens TaxID=154538 RepID=A0A1M2VU80_TRAPU|nr:hypothetical protein TRAPUB_12320 [Trametes pubescens]